MASLPCSERYVILISMMKSGTCRNLAKELMVALGYGMYGHVRVTPEIRPVLDGDALWRAAATMVYGDENAARLKARPEPEFSAMAERAWEALAWSLADPVRDTVGHSVGTELIDTGLVAEASRRTAESSFLDTPAGVCWTLHEFDVKKI